MEFGFSFSGFQSSHLNCLKFIFFEKTCGVAVADAAFLS